MNGDDIGAALMLSGIVCGVWGLYIADRCHLGGWECFLHGIFLGPFGLIMLLLYQRPNSTDSRDDETIELLTAIRAELQWQRQQKEKEIHRAKAAQANKP